MRAKSAEKDGKAVLTCTHSHLPRYNCQLLCTGGRRSSPPYWQVLALAGHSLGSALALSLAGQAAPLGSMEPQLSPSCPALGSGLATDVRIQRLRPRCLRHGR